MTKNKDCPHYIDVNSTMCKFCGPSQYDLHIKEHLVLYVSNNNGELQSEDMW